MSVSPFCVLIARGCADNFRLICVIEMSFSFLLLFVRLESVSGGIRVWVCVVFFFGFVGLSLPFLPNGRLVKFWDCR